MPTCHNCGIETPGRMHNLCYDCVTDYCQRRRQEGVSTTQIKRELQKGVKKWRR